jgi:hypothetical protein
VAALNRAAFYFINPLTLFSRRKNTMKFVTFRNIALLALALSFASLGNAQNLPLSGGAYFASDYGQWQGKVLSGPNTTGAVSYVMQAGYIVAKNGRSINPFSISAPVLIGTANQETATPSAVSGCVAVTQNTVQCTVTVTVANAHGQGELIQSGTFGLQEALNDAQLSGQNFGVAGIVTLDGLWTAIGGTDAMVKAALPYQLVTIEDRRFGTPVLWTPTQAAATVLAAPATLTAVTVGFGLNGANTTGGTYTGTSTYNTNCAYVDIMGNEGPASATFSALSAGSGTTNQLGFSAPAASTGAVGYTCYISLASGTYNLSYQVPVTPSTCTLTKLETVTPACALTNATYGQTGSNLIVSALTVNTAPLHLLATTASTTAAYIGTPSGRTTYAYAPHTLNAGFGFTPTQQAYAISVAAATTVPEVIGTIPVPTGFMNQAGRTIRICGQATEASAGSTATIQNFEFLWDAAGSNTAGAPVIIGQLQLTATLVTANADNWSFCWSGQTTVAGAGVTAGSIMPVGGFLGSTFGAGALGNIGVDVKAAAVASLNLAGTGGNTQRIHIVWLHTTGTDAAGVTLQGATVEIL